MGATSSDLGEALSSAGLGKSSERLKLKGESLRSSTGGLALLNAGEAGWDGSKGFFWSGLGPRSCLGAGPKFCSRFLGGPKFFSSFCGGLKALLSLFWLGA